MTKIYETLGKKTYKRSCRPCRARVVSRVPGGYCPTQAIPALRSSAEGQSKIALCLPTDPCLALSTLENECVSVDRL